LTECEQTPTTASVNRYEPSARPTIRFRSTYTGSLGGLLYLQKNADGTSSVMRKYYCPAPAVQLAEAFRFWMGSRRAGFRSREALYAANLAPARLIGAYDADTIIYSANPEDEPLNGRGGEFTKTYWPAAYRDNASACGLDPKDPKGRILMRDLAVGLDAAVRRHRARYDAELEMVYLHNVKPPAAG